MRHEKAARNNKILAVASSRFKAIDKRYLAGALDAGMSHGGLDQYELGLNIQTQGNKDQRTAQIVRHMFERPNTDELVYDLLDFLYLSASSGTYRMNSDAYRELKENVLDRRGVTLGDDGFTAEDELKTERDGLSQKAARPVSDSQDMAGAFVPDRDLEKVFLVRGRDTRPVAVVEQFLHFLGIGVINWTEAIKLTGKAQPHTYDVVKAGIQHAGAIIVIFSPDDEARVKPEFKVRDSDPELQVQGQARQNVILEAGMAFMSAPDRTIFLQSEPTRAISDIDGFNWVNLDGKWNSREDLINRLRSADVKANPVKSNLEDRLAGPFQIL